MRSQLFCVLGLVSISCALAVTEPNVTDHSDGGISSLYGAEAVNTEDLEITARRLRSGRRELRTNQPSVRADVEGKCDVVLWGDHIDHSDYISFIAAAVADGFGGGGAFLKIWLKEQLGDQASALSVSTLKEVILNKRTITLGKGTLRGGVASFKHWTDECRPTCTYDCGNIFGKCVGFGCSKCGTYRVNRPNTHQPYVCITKRNSPLQIGRRIVLDNSGYSLTTMNQNVPGGRVHLHQNVNDAGLANQLWELQGDLVKLTGTNLCLDSPTRQNGGYLHLIPCDPNNANQRWEFINGMLRLKGSNFCLDNDSPVTGQNRRNGNKIHMWVCLNNANQKWSLA